MFLKVLLDCMLHNIVFRIIMTKIVFKDIDIYYLTVDSKSRRSKHFRSIFKDYKVTEVLSLTDKSLSKEQSGAIGWCRLIDTALQKTPFKPFLLLEDDVSIKNSLPESITIPEDSDWVYIGISSLGVRKRRIMDIICGESIDEDYLRVYNMLSTHGVIINSPRGALGIHSACLEGFFNNRVWDYYIAQIQPWYNVYALKEPLVYQDTKFGGLSNTDITLGNCSELTKEYKNKGLVSFRILSPNSNYLNV